MTRQQSPSAEVREKAAILELCLDSPEPALKGRVSSKAGFAIRCTLQVKGCSEMQG